MLALTLLLQIATTSCVAQPGAPTLDHTIIGVHDLDHAATAFRRAGFRLKAGRLHANGLLNRHVKFPDGTEIELMSVQGSPKDDMARRYARVIATGDAGVYVALQTASLERVEHSARTAGLATRRSSSGPWQFLGFADTSTAANVFFTTGGGSVQDADSIFAHEPRVTELAEVWLEGGMQLRQLLLSSGAMSCGNVVGPDNRTGERFALARGSLVIVPARHRVRPRVLGAVLSAQVTEAKTIRPIPEFWIRHQPVNAEGSADVREVRALWQRFEDAYNRGDATAIGALFTDDADRTNNLGPWLRGRTAIQQSYGEMLARRAADPATRPFAPTISVRMVTTDVALVDGEYRSLRNQQQFAGRFVLVAVKRGGRWLFDAGRAWELPATRVP